MNKNFITIIYRKIHFSLIVISFVVIILGVFYYEGVNYEKFVTVLPENNLFKITYIIGLLVIFFGFLLSIYYEIKFDEKERQEYLWQYRLIEEQLDTIGKELPYDINKSSFYNRVKIFCDNSWKMGDTKEYMTYANLQKELLDYTLRMNDIDATVSWREEMSFVNKLIDLMKLCHATSNIKVDLFEISANYRFPIGLFVIPLYDAIEWSINTMDSSLRVECISGGGLWNCRIISRSVGTNRLRKRLRSQGFYDLKKRVDAGNWPIKLSKIFVEHRTEVLITGRYAG
ncbi:hypothetical protein [Sphingobacterium rhinopitheci]|uniref:hypothetical protein n=1 Tax=Sphingobacterium rhinopitheci TaxID=2781960 RepID=UPI001F5171B5|nr:hypothetical protein [Sphingobacterium rhinopitheci]MCI0922250.1 hypothetical protein [Sphingobacterium rhinopitheci]